MRIKLDENMPDLVAAFLVSQGCDVETVLSEQLGGSSDSIIISAARTERRVLITFDKGIADPRNPEYAQHAGVILLRLKHPAVSAIVSLLKAHYGALSDTDLAGRIVVLSLSGMRIR